MLLLYLSLLLAGRLGCFSIDILSLTALLNSDVCLPCPGHTGSGDVTWWLLRLWGKETLIKNGKKQTSDRHYDINTDGSLVIYNVQHSDITTYFCNNNNIILYVTSDPNMAAATAQPGCSVPRTTGSVPGPGPNPDPNQDQAQWKIPVAVVTGGTVVLAAMLVLKLLLSYEEIQDPEVKTAYYTRTTHTHTDTHTALYSTVNNLMSECVYTRVQKPEPGNIREKPGGHCCRKRVM